MGIMFSLLVNICFVLFYLYLRNKTEKKTIYFLGLPLFFNMITFFYPINMYSLEEHKVSFALFWSIMFLTTLNKIVNKDKNEILVYPVFLLTFISFLKYNYIFVNAVVFTITFFFLKNLSTAKRSRYIPVFMCIIAMTQFFFFTTVNVNIVNFTLYDFRFGKIFDLNNLSIFIMAIPLVFYFLASVKEQPVSIKCLMKAAFAILMIRLSTIISFNSSFLEATYFIIFLSVTIVMPLKKIDMTMYLFGISFAFMMDKDGSHTLPIYYVIGLFLGEITNILKERHFPFVHFFSGLLLLPYLNPYVTKIFFHLNELHIIAAVLFVLYYAKLLSFTFFKRYPR